MCVTIFRLNIYVVELRHQGACDVAPKVAMNETEMRVVKQYIVYKIVCKQYKHQRHNFKRDNKQEEVQKTLLRWRPRYFCLLMDSHLVVQPQRRASHVQPAWPLRWECSAASAHGGDQVAFDPTKIIEDKIRQKEGNIYFFLH